MNDASHRTETDERIKENRTPPPAPTIDSGHDDRSPLDVAFPEPKKDPDREDALPGG